MTKILILILISLPLMVVAKDNDDKQKDSKSSEQYEKTIKENSDAKGSNETNPKLTDYQNHLRSTNKVNHYEYLRNRKKVRRSHIKHEVNRKEFEDANDIYPGGKVSSMAVEARKVDSHDDNIDRFTRECIRHIRENLGAKFEFLEVSYLTKRSENPRDPAAFSVDMITGLCHAKPKSESN